MKTNVNARIPFALGRCFCGERDVARALLLNARKDLEEVPDNSVIPEEKASALEAMGFAFTTLTCETLKHQAFHPAEGLLTRAGLDRACERRASHAEYADHTWAFLPGPVDDIIPMELMLLNQHLPEADRDPDLSRMAEAMAATRYPADNALIVEFTTRLAAAGF